MPTPLVSVIIPAFNSEKCIAEALDSVFAQTYRPIEIIVVDDGSTDGTAKIVKNYQTSKTSRTNSTNLTYLYQENSGPSKARNTGIEVSKGEYIAFLDSDDIWTKDKLEKQMQLFLKDQTIDVVFSDAKITKCKNGKYETWTMLDRHGFDRRFFGHDFIVKNPLEQLLKTNFMLTPAVVMKKSCFKNGLFFNEKRKHAEDWELWLKLSLNHKFGCINDVCVHVKDEGDGLCSQSDQMLLSKIDVIEDFLRKNKSYVSLHVPRKKLSYYLRDTYKWAGYYFMRHKDNRLATKFYRKSLREAFDIKTCLYYIISFLGSIYKTPVHNG